MECRVEENEYFQYTLLFECNKGVKASDPTREGIGENAVLKEGHFDINEFPRSGRPSAFNKDRLKVLIRDDSRHQPKPNNWVYNCHMFWVKTTKSECHYFLCLSAGSSSFIASITSTVFVPIVTGD